MKKIICLVLFCIGFTGLTYSQSKSGYQIEGARSKPRRVRSDGGGDFMNKVQLGGGLGGIQFSENQIYMSFSALASYRWTDRLSTGVGLTYQFFKIRPLDISLHDYGANIFAQYVIYDPVYLMVRYEYLTLDTFDEGRFDYDTFLAGGGYAAKLGDKGVLNFFVLYNLLYDGTNSDNNGRYTSPLVIGTNIMFGF